QLPWSCSSPTSAQVRPAKEGGRDTGAILPTCDNADVPDIQRADARLKDWMTAPAHELDEVRQTMEAWNRGEFERWISEFAPDCEWYPTTEGGLLGEATRIRGHEGLRV